MFFVYFFFCYLSSMKIYKGVKIVETGEKKKNLHQGVSILYLSPFLFYFFYIF